MFGGEYFTRPILIDVTDAATQDDFVRDPNNQWETTKTETYYDSTHTNANRGDGTCTVKFDPASTKTYTHKACVDAGGDFTESVTGYYLSGSTGSSHVSLANDEFKKDNLKRYTADRIRDALQDLPNFSIPSVNVTNYVDSYSGPPWGNAFDITFTDQANSGKQNLLECVYSSGGDRACEGASPKLGEGSLDVGHGEENAHLGFGFSNMIPEGGELEGASQYSSFQAMGKRETLYGMEAESNTYVHDCTVHEVPLGTGSGGALQYEENSACSNRGLCDGTTGVCDCFEGHTGENCSIQTIFF
jgi:hypothetical protein